MDAELRRRKATPALAILEPYFSEPGTMALHDPLYLWMKEGREEDWDTFVQALILNRTHPAASLLAGLLNYRLPECETDDVLAEDRPGQAFDEPVAELRKRLKVLREQTEHQLFLLGKSQVRIVALNRVNQILSFALFVLAVVAILGWSLALDVWTIDWMEPPEPPEND